MARGTIVTRSQKDGTKRYACVIRIDGKQKWTTFAKKKDAEAYLDKNSTDIREGTYRELKLATFDGYLKVWKAKHLIPEKLKPATLNCYGSNIARHLSPAFGSRPMAAIDSDDVTRFESELLVSGQSPKSTRNLLNLASRIFRDAKADGYLRISPMMDLKLAKLPEREARALTKAEVSTLLEQCQSDPTLRLVVMLGLLAGLRRNEIFALSWEDVEISSNVIRVRRNLFWRHGKYQAKRKEDDPAWVLHPPKTAASIRAVDLSPKLKTELLSYSLQSGRRKGLIFQTGNGGPFDPHNFYERQFKSALERAMNDEEGNPRKDGPEFGDVTMHTLRHTFGSIKIEHNENLVYVSKQMGHAKPSITADVYAHLLKERRPEAALRTDEFLFGKSANRR